MLRQLISYPKNIFRFIRPSMCISKRIMWIISKSRCEKLIFWICLHIGIKEWDTVNETFNILAFREMLNFTTANTKIPTITRYGYSFDYLCSRPDTKPYFEMKVKKQKERKYYVVEFLLHSDYDCMFKHNLQAS